MVIDLMLFIFSPLQTTDLSGTKGKNGDASI